MTETSERLRQARERDEAAAKDETPDDDAQDASGEQDAPQAAAPQPTEAQINKAFESAGKSAQKFVAKIAPLLGAAEEDVVACPCCDFPGYVFAQRPALEGERLMAVKAVIGEEDVRAYRAANNAVECEACNGYGKLVRPTKVLDQMIAVCTACNGGGWHAPQQPVPQYEPPQQQQVYYPQPPPPPFNGPQPVYTPQA